MRVVLKPGVVAIAPENEAERDAFLAWRAAAAGHVFAFDGGSDKGAALLDLGLREEACREPINIVYTETDPRFRPISNLAHAPFRLDGRDYASVEGFWQGLRFSESAARARVAHLWGLEARHSGSKLPRAATFTYAGETYATGGPGHHTLMRRACEAKFAQNAEARDALLATGERPLTHRVPRDSATIPGALMADIWMRIRHAIRNTHPHGDSELT